MARPSFSRWWLVAAAALSLGMAGLYQFTWSSIRGPLAGQVGAGETAVGAVFSVFVVFQTVSQFPAGWVRDRYGPRRPLVVGAALLGAGYLGAALATDVRVAYVAYAAGGVGAGVAYTVAINTPVKWFGDRRGLATGVVGVAYGGASFLLIPLVRRGITTRFEATLLAMAAISAAAVLLAAAVLRDPPGLGPDGGSGDADARDGVGDRPGQDSSPTDAGDDAGAGGSPAPAEPGRAAPEPAATAHRPAYTWREAIRTRQFWLLYAVFVVVNGVGLMLIGKVVTYADQFGLAAAVGTASASAVAVFDAGGVLGGGWAADRFGPVRTAAACVVLCGLAIAGSVVAGAGEGGLAFVGLVGAAAFFRAPVFAIFPGLVGTYYGEAHSSANYALLYSSKLWGGLFGGAVASGLVVTLGWSATFGLGAAAMVAAGLALTRLRPV